MMTAAQMCAEWKISPRTLYRFIAEGTFPAGEPAGKRAVRWRRSVVEAGFAAMNPNGRVAKQSVGQSSPMTGFFAGLSDEQKKMALEYRGDETHGGAQPRSSGCRAPRFMTDGELREHFGLSERALQRLRLIGARSGPFPQRDKLVGKTDSWAVHAFFDRRSGVTAHGFAPDGEENFNEE